MRLVLWIVLWSLLVIILLGSVLVCVVASQTRPDAADALTEQCAREAGIERGPGKVITPEQMARFTACIERHLAKSKR
jgi:hypothetical protein